MHKNNYYGDLRYNKVKITLLFSSHKSCMKLDKKQNLKCCRKVKGELNLRYRIFYMKY